MEEIKNEALKAKNETENVEMGGGKTMKPEVKNDFLVEITPHVEAILEIAQKYKEEGKEASAILLAGDGNRHTTMVHGRGGDLRYLMFEAFTDEKPHERMFMDVAKLIAIRGIAGDMFGGIERKQNNDREGTGKQD